MYITKYKYIYTYIYIYMDRIIYIIKYMNIYIYMCVCVLNVLTHFRSISWLGVSLLKQKNSKTM